jgi:cell division septation protein DedD
MGEALPRRAVVELSRTETGAASAASEGTEGVAAPRESPRASSNPAGENAKPPADGKGRFTLQVRAFPERDRAEELVEHLRQRGVRAYLSSGEVRGRGKWFRVRVGRFSSRDDAERFRRDFVARQNTEAFITVVR